MKDVSAQIATAGATSLETIKGEIVTQTLDKLNGLEPKEQSKKNTSAQCRMKEAYDLSKSVLSAVYEGKGAIIDNNR